MANLKNIKKWVNALESGEYKQTRGALKKHGRYCCLGVVCDIYCKETGVKFKDIKNKGVNQEFLPSKIGAWLGFDKDSRGETYVKMNDDKGMKFKEIAKEIRREYLNAA